MEKLSSENFESKVLHSNKLVLVEFYSDGCIPCKKMAPILAELEENYEGRLVIGRVNAGFAPELAREYRVMSSPTFFLFKNGEQLKRFSGVQDAGQLEDIIKEAI